MRARALLLTLSLALSTAFAGAADDGGVKAKFDQAFSNGQSSDKKEALRAAQGLGKDHDDLAFELLIRGVNDRQVHDEAVLALRARTGLQPTLLNRGNGYPGYPASDDASEWNNWLGARKKDKETQKKIAEQETKLKEIEEAKKKAAASGKDDPAAAPGDKTGKPAGDTATSQAEPKEGDKPDKPAKPEYQAPSDLGKLDRIVFKTGGSLVCYILSKRVNADGVLQSVRIVHQNNGGEEILAADLIARVDEDIR
jgi:hypothetical protein